MRRVATFLDIPARELWLVVAITALIAVAIAAFAATALGTPARRALGAEASGSVPDGMGPDLAAGDAPMGMDAGEAPGLLPEGKGPHLALTLPGPDSTPALPLPVLESAHANARP